MGDEVADLSNIGLPRLWKHHRSNAIKSCCRKNIELDKEFFVLLGENMRPRSLFEVVIVLTSSLLRFSDLVCPVRLSWSGALSDVK